MKLAAKSIFLPLFFLFIISFCTRYDKEVGFKENQYVFDAKGVYFIDSGDSLLPSKDFQKIMRKLREAGYQPLCKQYIYTKRAVARPITAPKEVLYDGSYIKGIWSIDMIPMVQDPVDSGAVIRISEFQLVDSDTIKMQHITNFFGTAGMDKHNLPWGNYVYYFEALNPKYTSIKDSIFNFVYDVEFGRR